jgi:hypothetical protein
MRTRRLFAVMFLFVFVFAFAFTFTAQESAAIGKCCHYYTACGLNYGTYVNGICDCMAVSDPYNCYLECASCQ